MDENNSRTISMSKQIKLNKGYITIVDDKYYAVLNNYIWRVSFGGRYRNNLYAVRHRLSTDKIRPYTISMHRQIMEFEGHNIKNKQIDHINHNTLDNTTKNLRLANHIQNNRYRKKSKRNTSGYKGVIYSRNKWRVRIRIDNNKRIEVGSFLNKEDAARAYDAAAIKYHKEFALTNFPKENYELSK